MEAFGMMGYMIGTLGFIFGLSALSKVSALEKALKEAGVLDKKPK